MTETMIDFTVREWVNPADAPEHARLGHRLRSSNRVEVADQQDRWRPCDVCVVPPSATGTC